MSGGEWQTKFSVSPGPGLWFLVLGPFGPDLGPDLTLTIVGEYMRHYLMNKETIQSVISHFVNKKRIYDQLLCLIIRLLHKRKIFKFTFSSLGSWPCF